MKGSAVHVDYDPRAATAVIESLGFSKGSDGIYHDAAGQVLEIQRHSGPTDLLQKSKLAVANQWQQLGISEFVLGEHRC